MIKQFQQRVRLNRGESYFHGFYTSEQGDSGKAKAVGLRKNNHYSVLLAHFHAKALAETITIAQIFWLKPGEKTIFQVLGRIFSSYEKNYATLKMYRFLMAMRLTHKRLVN